MTVYKCVFPWWGMLIGTGNVCILFVCSSLFKSDTVKKPEYFHTSGLKLAGTSAMLQLLPLGSPSTLTASATLLHYQLPTSLSAKGDGHAGAVGERRSHFPLAL